MYTLLLGLSFHLLDEVQLMEGGGKVGVQNVSRQADYTDGLSGFSPDPYLSGVQVVSTIAIVQHAGSMLIRH